MQANKRLHAAVQFHYPFKPIERCGVRRSLARTYLNIEPPIERICTGKEIKYTHLKRSRLQTIYFTFNKRHIENKYQKGEQQRKEKSGKK